MSDRPIVQHFIVHDVAVNTINWPKSIVTLVVCKVRKNNRVKDTNLSEVKLIEQEDGIMQLTFYVIVGLPEKTVVLNNISSL